MLHFVKSILAALDLPVTDFNLGYFFALTVVALALLVLLVIRIIIKIIFRKKRCHTIRIKADNGNAFISGAAVMAVIKALEKEFRALTINKVNLFRCRNKPFMEVNLDFDASKGGLPDYADKFKLRVIESLDALFGIKNIKQVHLHLRHIRLNGSGIMKTAEAADDADDTLRIPETVSEIPAPAETPVKIKLEK
ncbi:MAG: hypothetical protein PHH77_00075 [Victivallaceae bacterium]|nr:hypothetical protein [Victivallaceae bacterium]